LIPLSDVVGNGTSVAPEQIAVIGLNVGVISWFTVTVVEHVELFPHPSVTVQLIIETPVL
jgi:hypothetical protein